MKDIGEENLKKHENCSNTGNDKVEGMIRGSLDFLDEAVRVDKPDLMKLVEMVNNIEEKKESGRNRQFFYFIITAVLAISLEIYSFQVSMVFFAAVQALALLCLVPAAIVKSRSKLRQVPRL